MNIIDRLLRRKRRGWLLWGLPFFTPGRGGHVFATVTSNLVTTGGDRYVTAGGDSYIAQETV